LRETRAPAHSLEGRVTMSDNHTPLAELPNAHLLREAGKYRAMAAIAMTAADHDDLERVAVGLERMVDRRKLNASSASDFQ
jgi:serine/threonine protein kinase HipA of HipAB toxin-antitoxin module